MGIFLKSGRRGGPVVQHSRHIVGGVGSNSTSHVYCVPGSLVALMHYHFIFVVCNRDFD